MNSEDNPYHLLGLTHNPFPLEPVETRLFSIDDLREDIQRFVEDIRRKEIQWLEDKIISPLKKGTLCPNIWIRGVRGVGKSALLKYITWKLQDSPILCIYIKRPERGLQTVYEETIKFLGPSFFAKLSLTLYSQFFQQMEKNDAKTFIKEEVDRVLKFLKDRELEFPAKYFLRESEEDKKVLEENDILVEYVDKKKLFNAMSAWLVSKFGTTPRRLAEILAKFPAQPDIEFLNLLRVSRNEERDALASIIRLAKHGLRITRALMILDELDQAWEGLSKQQKRKFGLMIRSLYEATRGDLLFIAVAVPEMLRELYEGEVAGYYISDVIPALDTNILALEPYDADQTKILVAKYLEKARLPGMEGFIEPFTENVVTEIQKRTRGNAREMIQQFRMLIETAAREKVSVIDEYFLEKCLPSISGESQSEEEF